MTTEFDHHPLSLIGTDLYQRIAELEKNITGYDDEDVKAWEGGEKVDPEKLEMQERVLFLEEQQNKILARYEHMRQTLSTVSGQVLRLKRKLHADRTEAVMRMASENHINVSFIPRETEQLKELIRSLRAENKEYASRIAKKEAKAKEKEKEKGEEGDQSLKESAPVLEQHQHLITRGTTVIAGTTEKLLATLLSKANPDASFSADFLCVYLSFMPASDLLKAIIAATNSGEESETASRHNRAYGLMKVWISCNYLEFSDEKFRKDTIDFISSLKSIPEAQTQALSKTLTRKVTKFERNPRIYVIPESTKWNLLEINSAKLAKQWTLNDMKLYKLIDPRVALSDPTELLLTKRIAVVNEWVKNEIEKQPSKTSIVKKFLELMEHCRRVRNIFGVFTFYEAVNASSSEARKLMSKGIKKLSDLCDLVSPANNYATYRSVLEQKNLPSLPNFKFSLANFIDTLKEPTVIADSNPELINFVKFRKAARTIQEIQFFQKSPYDKVIDVDPTLMGYVQALPGSAL